jgi:hypothetical protein
MRPSRLQTFESPDVSKGLNNDMVNQDIGLGAVMFSICTLLLASGKLCASGN